MNETIRKVDDQRHVRAELLFADPSGEAPSVLIPKSDEGTVRRGGLDHREVLIASGRDIADTFDVDKEGFAFLTGASTVENFEDEAEVERVYYPEIKKIVDQKLLVVGV